MKKPLLKALSYSKCDKLDQGLLVERAKLLSFERVDFKESLLDQTKLRCQLSSRANQHVLNSS